MKKLLILSVILTLICSCNSLETDTPVFSKNQIIITDDINNFWKAYDAIHETDDTLRQKELLQSMFLEKASLGQQKMIEARRYTADEYLKSIKERPLFWNSIRENMENLDEFNEELKAGVDKLAEIYPSLTMSTIYYTVGNFRSPGTGVDSMVLIGSEFALGDTSVNTSELPEHVQNYYQINPIDRLEFLTVHEYIHTQQNEMVYDLLPLTLYEGIAEFMAIKATKQNSPWKAFDVGVKNEERVKERFEQDMFRPNTVYNWLWNSSENEFEAHDMSYYVGSKLASLYYDKADNKENAIKQLIELDYSNEDEIASIVDRTNYFSGPIEELSKEYESKRPEVLSVELEKNGGYVQAGKKVITVNFSEEMNREYRGFDYGPLGEEHVLRVEEVIGFSEDGKSFSFVVEVKEDQHYQSTLTTNFRSEAGFPLKPYLIDFETK